MTEPAPAPRLLGRAVANRLPDRARAGAGYEGPRYVLCSPNGPLRLRRVRGGRRGALRPQERSLRA